VADSGVAANLLNLKTLPPPADTSVPGTGPGTMDYKVPYLEHYPEQGGPAERVPLLKIPFTLGRAETTDHVVYSNKISKEHAAIVRVGDHYAVRDLDSMNGTFVNGRRTTEQVLVDGDIIHLAHLEFCFRHDTSATAPMDRTVMASVERTQAVESTLPESVIRGTRLLREMIADARVQIAYQPIVDLRTRAIVGYEALGRGDHPELSRSPVMLFRLAEQCDQAIELSELFRRLAVVKASQLPSGAKLFVNVHPLEVASPAFIDSLVALKDTTQPEHPIVIEIAESSITDPAAMARNRKAFTDLGFEFAYDDFGAGQSRLIELSDIPPDYLKLDMTVIQGIEGAKSRQDVVRALLRVVGALGVRVIAEGIETEDVALTCHELGCHLGQGYLFGRPR
jgi:EAL domain-containing protein (putative c-di-GMP-specific phosphodiesterase class I)